LKRETNIAEIEAINKAKTPGEFKTVHVIIGAETPNMAPVSLVVYLFIYSIFGAARSSGRREICRSSLLSINGN
jgi:hypothetical protein